jgi:DNA-binding transcriptional MerR regulator
MLKKNQNNTLENTNFLISSRSIREVSAIVGVPQYVLRFWESKFSNVIKPTKSNNKRNYSEEDISMLQKIKSLLYDQGYTIKGVQNLFNANDKEEKMENSLEKTQKLETETKRTMRPNEQLASDIEFTGEFEQKLTTNSSLNEDSSPISMQQFVEEESSKRANLKTMVIEASNEVLKAKNHLSVDKIKLTSVVIKLKNIKMKMEQVLENNTI